MHLALQTPDDKICNLLNYLKNYNFYLNYHPR